MKGQLFFCSIILFFPAFLYPVPGVEIQCEIYYGLPVHGTDYLFYDYSPSDVDLDYQMDFSYLLDLRLEWRKLFIYFSMINQHTFFSSADPVFIDQFYRPDEYADETFNRVTIQKYNLGFFLGQGISLFTELENPVFGLELSAGLYLQIFGKSYQLKNNNTTTDIWNGHDFFSLEIHSRLTGFLKILSWLSIESFIDVSVCNLNLFFIPFFIGGSNYLNFDIIAAPVKDLKDLGLRFSFLYEFLTFNDTTPYGFRPGFDPRDIYTVPRVGVGISYDWH